jgi:multiple sugar transport system substrate-binding protein
VSRTNRGAWAFLAVFALVVVACGPSDTADTTAAGGAVTTAAGGAETTTAEGTGTTTAEGAATTTGESAGGDVTFWTSHTAGTDINAFQAITDDFNALGGTQVELVQVTGTETDATQLITAVRGGTGPDVYMLDRFTVAQRASDGLLEDLTQFSDDPLAGYIEFAAAEASYNDVAYALPFDTDTRALYYNIGMLEEAGIDTAPLDPANGPITWDQLKEMANQLNVEEGDGYSRLGIVPWQTWANGQSWHYTYGFSFGADFYDEAACQVTPTDPNNVAAFQYVYDWAAELGPEAVQAFTAAAQDPNLPQEQFPFVTEQVGFLISGDWMIANQEDYAPDIDYGITYLPVTEEGAESTTWAGGWSLVIPEGAQNPEGGFEFMSYMAGEEGQRLYATDTAHLPTLEVLQGEEGLLDERHQFFADLLPNAQSRPPLPVGALYWDELSTAWNATYLNEGTPDQLLQTVQDRVQPQLDQFCG